MSTLQDKIKVINKCFKCLNDNLYFNIWNQYANMGIFLRFYQFNFRFTYWKTGGQISKCFYIELFYKLLKVEF